MNSIFIEEFKLHQEKYVKQEEYVSVEDKFINGCCNRLVDALLKLNKNEGQSLRLCEPLDDNGNSIIHFIYKSKEGLFYDINGEFKTVELLAEASGLFSDALLNLHVDIDFDEPYSDDYLIGELEETQNLIDIFQNKERLFNMINDTVNRSEQKSSVRMTL